jgi:hypothetical protein
VVGIVLLLGQRPLGAVNSLRELPLFSVELALLLGLKETSRFFIFHLFLLYRSDFPSFHFFLGKILLYQIENLKEIIYLEKLEAQGLQNNLAYHKID